MYYPAYNFDANANKNALGYSYQFRFRSLSAGLTLTEYFNYNLVTLLDDVGWIFQSIESTTVYGFSNIETNYLYTDNNSNSTASYTIYSVIVNPQRNNFQIYRSYMKVQTLLANIGGVIKIIMIIFGYLSSVIGNMKFYNMLIDDLYCYSSASQNMSNRDGGILPPKLENNFVLNNNLNNSNANESGVLDVTNNNNKKSSLSLKNLKSIVMTEDNDIIKESLFTYMRRLFCKRCSSERKLKQNQVYFLGVKDIEKKLDIICYLKTIQMIDHMADTVYNETQSSIVKSYQKVNLAKVEFNESQKMKKETQIKDYFKEKLKSGELQEIDLRIFEILPKETKKSLLI